jgi:hypothetical protein
MPPVTEEVPSGLLTLKLPPGYSLDRWVEEETERLKAKYPHPHGTKELGPRWRRMHEVASHRRKQAETTYELFKLKLWEKAGDAETVTSQGIGFKTRRQYHVPTEPAKWECGLCGAYTSKDGFWTPGYEMDAWFPV